MFNCLSKVIWLLMVMECKSDYKSLNYKFFKNSFENFLYVDRVAFLEEFQRKVFSPILHPLSK